MPEHPQPPAVTEEEEFALSSELIQQKSRPLYYAHRGLIGASRLATEGAPSAESLAAKHEALKRKASACFLSLSADKTIIPEPSHTDALLSSHEERQVERFVKTNRALILDEAECLELDAGQAAELIVDWMNTDKQYVFNEAYVTQRHKRINRLRKDYARMIDNRNPSGFPQESEDDGRTLAERASTP